MGGLICKREILAHPAQIVRAFGWRVLVRCLLASRRTTFLSILSTCNRI